MTELRQKLYKICDENNASKMGTDFLINHYMCTLNWSEERSIRFIIKLFKTGTVQKIRLLKKDGTGK